MIVNKPKYKKCPQYKMKKNKRIEEEEKSDTR